MQALSETSVIFLHELRRGVRSAKALVLLILFALASTLVCAGYVVVSKKAETALAQAAGGTEIPSETKEQMKKEGVKYFFSDDEQQTVDWLVDVPVVVLLFFKMTLLFLPLLALLIGFDQVSGELQSRSIRFASLRARRGSLLAGKLLSQAVLLLGLTAVVNAGLFVFAVATEKDLAVGSMLFGMIRLWLLALVYTAAYLGLAALCSSLFRTPIYSLLTGLCALFGFWLLAVLPRIWDSLKFLSYATPSFYERGLMSPEVWPALGSVGAFLGFAGLFIGMAYLALRGRDL